MPPQQIAPLCANCQTPMVIKEKEGNKFWGCPNWRECRGKTQPYFEPKPPQTHHVAPQQTKSAISDKDILSDMNILLKAVYDDVQAIKECLSTELPTKANEELSRIRNDEFIK